MASSPFRVLALCILMGVVACGGHTGEAPLPTPTSVTARQTQPEEVLPGQGFKVTVRLSNASSVPAENVRVREVFQGTTRPEAEEVVGSLAAGEERTVTFNQAAPVVAARGEEESAATYQQRLEALEGQRLLSQGEVHFADAKGVQGQPLTLSSASRLVLPRLTLGLVGPAQVLPGQAATYTVTASNAGAAIAASGSARVVLPDGTQVEVPLEALAPGANWRKEVAWTEPPLPARQQGETASEYTARLRALHGQVRKTQVAFSWKDSQGNTYGPLAQEAAATLEIEVPPFNTPPDPGEVAPPLPTTSIAPFLDAVSFLYTGSNPIQQGVQPGTLEARRVAVLRGKVKTRQGIPLDGVHISVLHHPEYGFTRTRVDGHFDLAVNGGGPLTVQYEAEGFLPAQRTVQVPWADYAWLPEVVLVPLDAQATAVDFSGASGAIQVARGSVQADADGTRQATLLFAPGTLATLVLPDGSQQPLYGATVRATEYTVGGAGPASMPGELPPTSGYTYAVELSVDEALVVGAREVRFSKPVASYVENFLGFPVGGAVPAGYYDRTEGVWKASDNGRVLSLHSVVDGVARLDVTGDGQPDDASLLAALGVTEEELRQLAALYAPGKSLWRVPVTHFTPWDYNWPYGPPPDARPPRMAPPRNGDLENKPDCKSGSVIECQNQVLGESLPLTGTPIRLHFSSERVPGRRDKYTLRIPVSGASVPDSLRRIAVEFTVAGRRFTYSLPPAPNQALTFTWDGKDGYGRAVQGAVPVLGRTGYVYDAVYLKPADFQRAFALVHGSTAVAAGRQDMSVTMWQAWESMVGGWNAQVGDLAGWHLSVHHQLDARAGTLYLGHGGRSSGSSGAGTLRTVAGRDGFAYYGDGGPATQAYLFYPNGVAVGPDGSLYIADRLNHCIRRVAPDGIISTVAGTGIASFSGDGGPATQARLYSPNGVAVGPDGSLYIAEFYNHRIRRVAPDGIISTVAGTGIASFGGDGGPATQAYLYYPSGVAVGPDGSLYISDHDNHRIRRVAPDGIISTVAGTGTASFSGDGGPATQAYLYYPYGVAVGPDGSLYIADHYNHRIRRVGPDGTISTVAGTGAIGFDGDGGPATQARLSYPAGVAVGPDGSLYISDSSNHRIRVLKRSLWTATLGERAIPSEDGGQVYVFGDWGRHLRTLEALTGALRHRFDYDAHGRLSSITDGDGLMTRVERDVEGKPVAIVAPHGQRTRLTLDARGYLASTTNPADETVHVTHSPDGLLTSMRDARGGLHTYIYDGMGRLRKDTDPAGGHKGLVRTQASDGFGYTVTFSTTLGATTLYETQQLPQGGQKRIITAPDGTTTVRRFGTDGTTATTAPDGTVTTEMEGPDARFGMQAPLLASHQVRLPSGLTFTSNHSNTVRYVTGDTSNGIDTLSDTLTRNGRAFVATYTASTRTLTTKSPEGRLTTSTLDEKGRLVRQEVPGVLPVEVSYDVEGRPWKVTRGSRTQTHTYNASGYLEKVEDALGRTTSFSYNLAGRLTSQQLPGGRTVGLSFDAHGNLTQLVPPGRPAHAFLYTPTDTTASYTPPPPFSSTPLPSTQYAYNMDGALTSTTLPDGSSVQVARDGAGRVDFLTTPRTTVDFGYDAQGRLSALTNSTGPSLAYAYDGPLVKRVEWSGGVRGSVGYTYTSDFTLGTLEVQGQSFAYGYDNDGLLTSAGALSLSRRKDNGLLSSTTLDQVTTGQQYTPHGDVQTLSAAFGSTSLYSLTLGRDTAGRIISKTEVAQGVTHEWGYTYDVAGRLHTVTLNGAPYATYGHDANGNRTSITQGSSALTATYDAQDRLQTHGAVSYTFGPNGDLQQRLRPPEVAPTQYTYDALGALTHVRLPDGTQVDYVVDALGRRVGKRLQGTLVQGFLYDGPLRVVAELDGTGAVVSRFLYASQSQVPDYMVKGGVTYRLLADHLGSVRLVVNTGDGSVAQALEYGPWGEVLSDSNPGFQPFGFAGGLHDNDTGLTRFGARDYDAETGRWTAKDPIRFAGGDTNLYNYAGGDPVNFIDPDGHTALHLAAGVVGGVFGAALAAANGDSILLGALTGALSGLTAGGGIASNLVYGAFIGAAGYLGNKDYCDWSVDGAGTATTLGGLGGVFGRSLGLSTGLSMARSGASGNYARAGAFGAQTLGGNMLGL